MTKNGVVITGMGIVSSLGNTSQEVFKSLLESKSNFEYFKDWEDLVGLKSFVGSYAQDYNIKILPRSVRRSMSKMSEMAFIATKDALDQAQITITDPQENDFFRVDSDRTLLIMGSTTGSPETMAKHYKKLIENNGPKGQLSTSFLKIMNHSVAANVALGLNFSGPLIANSSACSSSSHCLAIATELIQAGLYDIAIVGGADELHHTSTSVFDLVRAATRQMDIEPNDIPGPFDHDRDGLIVSEGAGILVIESEEHAAKRGATSIAKVDAGAYICDGIHMTQPQIPSMQRTMKRALKNAKMEPSQIDYINAHATGTLVGDHLEAQAIYEIFGDNVPTSSLKGHFGHSLAACGTIELISSIEMMKNDTIIPTKNLKKIDEKCVGPYLPKVVEKKQINTVLSNNFAFGGMNSTIIISKV